MRLEALYNCYMPLSHVMLITAEAAYTAYVMNLTYLYLFICLCLQSGQPVARGAAVGTNPFL